MEAKHCLHLGIFLYLAIISEAGVIVPRNLGEEIPFSINPLEKDNRLGLKPAVWGPPIGDSEYSDNSGIIDPAHPPLINDYGDESGWNVDKEDNRPGTNPERFPINADREKRPNENPEEKDEIDNSGDDNFINEHSIGDPDKFGNDDKDFKLPPDEDKPINKEGDESEVENTSEESEEESNVKENKPEDEDEERPDEEKEEDEPVEDGNNEKYEPEVEEQPDEEESNDINDKEHKPEDEDKPDEERKEDEEDEDKPEEERKEDKEDEDKPDEERKEDEEDEKYEAENDDGKKYVPEEESTDEEKNEASEGSEDDKNGDESIPQEGEKGLFSGGSIFDTPYFNLEQVKNYFSKLDSK